MKLYKSLPALSLCAAVALMFWNPPACAEWVWVEGEAARQSTMNRHPWYNQVKREALSGGDLTSGAHTDVSLTFDGSPVDGSTYTVQISGDDLAGNSGSDSNTAVVYDITVPTVGVTITSPTTTNVGAGQLRWNSCSPRRWKRERRPR